MLLLCAATCQGWRRGMHQAQDLVVSSASSLKYASDASDTPPKESSGRTTSLLQSNDKSVALPLDQMTGNIAINEVKLRWVGKPLASGSHGIVQMIQEVVGSRQA